MKENLNRAVAGELGDCMGLGSHASSADRAHQDYREATQSVAYVPAAAANEACLRRGEGSAGVERAAIAGELKWRMKCLRLGLWIIS
jgi:hypothetical protein